MAVEADQQAGLVGETTSQAMVADTSWAVAYASLVVVLDCLAIFLGLAAGYLLRFGDSNQVTGNLDYGLGVMLAGPVWLGFLVVHHCYDVRLFGAGPGEFRRIVLATIRLFGLLTIVCFLGKLQPARVFVGIAMVVGLALLITGRYAARKWLHRKRLVGGWSRRVLVLGDRRHVNDLARVVVREPFAGLSVVGACYSDGAATDVDDDLVDALGSLDDAVAVARHSSCDTIAVTASPDISGDRLRRLAWDLEGTGISLIVAPALIDVAGPRISIHPVAGLPLLYIDEPQIGLVHRVVKRTMDLSIACSALVALSPLLVVVALAVKLDTPGPIIFRQTRVGRGGREFTTYKFRSMHADAERQLAALAARNEASGPLFKVRRDPRITRLGRLLRRASIDELPQLWNVIRGDMSLVGPRPPLPREVEAFGSDVRRRFLVKPGITGLWQVSGRSDLSWDDSVRLDLYYVENWSPVLDLVIMLRTLVTVVRGVGAY